MFIALHLFYLTLAPRKPCKVASVTTKSRNIEEICHSFLVLQEESHFACQNFKAFELKIIEANGYLYFNTYQFFF